MHATPPEMYELFKLLSYQHGFVVACAGAVPELVLILALFFIPESPRWLVQQSCHFDYCRRQDTTVLVFTPIYLCTR